MFFVRRAPRRLLAMGAGLAAAHTSIGGVPTLSALARSEQEPSAYKTPPAKMDDPEENAKVLDRWRAHIQEARELWSKLDVAGAERALTLALEEASQSAPCAEHAR